MEQFKQFSRWTLLLIMAIFSASSVSSCGDTEEIEPEEWLTGQSCDFDIRWNWQKIVLPAMKVYGQWQSDIFYPDLSQRGWVTLSQNNGGPGSYALHVECAENFTSAKRKAVVTISCRNKKLVYRITQDGNPDYEEGPATALVSRITMKHHNASKVDICKEQVDFKYQEGAISAATYSFADYRTSETRYIDMVVDRQVSNRTYVFAEGEKRQEHLAKLDGSGRFVSLDDLTFDYERSEYLLTLSHGGQDWYFDWEKDVPKRIRSSNRRIEFQVKADMNHNSNIDINGLLLMSYNASDYQGALSKAIFAERGNWGSMAGRLLNKIFDGERTLAINYVYDGRKRIIQILGYELDVSIAKYGHKFTCDVVYVD